MKGKRIVIIVLAVMLVVSLSVAGTALAARNGNMLGQDASSAALQNNAQNQNGAPESTCTDCEQTRLQSRSQDRACDGSCDGTCDGTGDQRRLRDGSGDESQQRLRDGSCN